MSDQCFATRSLRRETKRRPGKRLRGLVGAMVTRSRNGVGDRAVLVKLLRARALRPRTEDDVGRENDAPKSRACAGSPWRLRKLRGASYAVKAVRCKLCGGSNGVSCVVKTIPRALWFCFAVQDACCK
eukprot:7746875-Pyramimonas_sp.AAC.1